MKRIFVLLAGINDYQHPVGKLNGCIKDLNNIEAFLNKYYSPGYDLNIVRLEDQNATYANIISGFRTHLSQAAPDDIVWFHYSGHGSEEFTANEFWPIEPKGLDQTLVCYDSGFNGVQNLADKELAVLLHEVETLYPDRSPKEGAPHIVVSLDCCHSGSGTRSASEQDEVRTRNTPSLHRSKRPFETYVDGYFAKRGAPSVPLSRHIVLSACESVQKAGDLPIGGAFTTGLIVALKKSAGEIDYVDLFQQVRSTVKKIRRDQNPQFDTIGNFNPYTRFLDGAPFGSPERYEVTEKNGDWYVECGAIHGLPSGSPVPIEFDIYTPAPDHEYKGGAALKSVGAFNSPIDLDLNLDLRNLFKSITSKTPQYRAQLKYLPIPPELVFIEGDESGLHDLIQNWDRSNGIVYTMDADDPATLQVVCHAERYEVIDHRIGRTAWMASRDEADAAKQVILALGKIVKWQRFLALENRDARSKLSRQVEFELEITEISDNGQQSFRKSAREVKLYANSNNTFNRSFGIVPIVRVLDSSKRLYFYCLKMGSDHSIRSEEGVRVFDPAQRPDVQIYEQRMFSDIMGFGPDDDETACSDWFKLLVTTSELDVTKFLQSGLERTRGERSWGPDLTEDWATFDIQLNIVWQDNRISSDTPLSMGGLVIAPHPEISCSVGISAINQLPWSADPSRQFLALQSETSDIINISGRPDRRTEILELRDLSGAVPALADDPITINFRHLDNDASIIPVGLNGQRLEVIGYSEMTGDSTVVYLTHLPDKVAQPVKDVHGAVTSPYVPVPADRSLFDTRLVAFVALRAEEDIKSAIFSDAEGTPTHMANSNRLIGLIQDQQKVA